MQDELSSLTASLSNNDIKHSNIQEQHNDLSSLTASLSNNDIKYNDTKYNDTKYNDTKYNDTKYNDIKYNDSQYNNDIKYSNTQYNNDLKELFDPLFINLKVKIPKKIERIFKGVDNISFIYEIAETDFIEIIELKSRTILFKIHTSEYENYPFLPTGNEQTLQNGTKNLVFIFEREKFKIKHKTEQNKKYKDSVHKSTRFTESKAIKELQQKYLEYQIENQVNFVFIEDSQMLHSQLRSLISIRKEEDRYLPKTQKFEEDQKREFLKSILEAIPGISEGVSKALSDKFTDINSFANGLLNKDVFMGIKIIDEKGGVRNMTEKVYFKIYRAFYSDDCNEKL